MKKQKKDIIICKFYHENLTMTQQSSTIQHTDTDRQTHTRTCKHTHTHTHQLTAVYIQRQQLMPEMVEGSPAKQHDWHPENG